MYLSSLYVAAVMTFLLCSRTFGLPTAGARGTCTILEDIHWPIAECVTLFSSYRTPRPAGQPWRPMQSP